LTKIRKEKERKEKEIDQLETKLSRYVGGGKIVHLFIDYRFLMIYMNQTFYFQKHGFETEVEILRQKVSDLTEKLHSSKSRPEENAKLDKNQVIINN